MVIGADCHDVEGNQGEVGANLHSTAQIDIQAGLKPDCSDPIHLHFCAIMFSRIRFQKVFNGVQIRLDCWN